MLNITENKMYLRNLVDKSFCNHFPFSFVINFSFHYRSYSIGDLSALPANHNIKPSNLLAKLIKTK